MRFKKGDIVVYTGGRSGTFWGTPGFCRAKVRQDVKHGDAWLYLDWTTKRPGHTSRGDGGFYIEDFKLVETIKTETIEI